MIKAYYQTSKILKSGKETKARKRLSRSFLKQFLQILAYGMFSSPNDYIRRVYGDTNTMTNYSLYPDSGWHYYAIAGEGSLQNNNVYQGYYYYDNASFGIMIGNDDTPVTSIDYRLGNVIQHGNSSAKMRYLGMFVDNDITVSNPNATYSLERMFYNNSGLDIVVKELGIYSYSYPPNWGSYIFCQVRDVISPVTVSTGEYFKVKYTLQVTV